MASLSPHSFNEIKTSGVPVDSMNTLSQRLLPYYSMATTERLSEELYNFAVNWDMFKLTMDQFYMNNMLYYEDGNTDGQDAEVLPKPVSVCKSCQNCVVCCYQTIIKYNMYQGAYLSLRWPIDTY